MPLTKEQRTEMKRNIAEGEKLIKEATIDLAAAKRAGLDMAEEEKEVKRVRDLMRGIKRVYG